MTDQRTSVEADPLFDVRGPMWGTHHRLGELPLAKEGSLEERVRLLEEELALRDVMARFYYHYDGNDLDGTMGLFHEDCVLINPMGTWIGKEAIRRLFDFFIKGRKLAFHQVTNLTVRLRDEGRYAWATCYYHGVQVGHRGGVIGIAGTYADRLMKVDGQWQFVERMVTSNYRHVLTPPPPGGGAPPPTPSRPETSGDIIGPDYMM